MIEGAEHQSTLVLPAYLLGQIGIASRTSPRLTCKVSSRLTLTRPPMELKDEAIVINAPHAQLFRDRLTLSDKDAFLRRPPARFIDARGLPNVFHWPSSITDRHAAGQHAAPYSHYPNFALAYRFERYRGSHRTRLPA